MTGAIEKAREIHAAATPGPWRATKRSDFDHYVADVGMADVACDGKPNSDHMEDARAIAFEHNVFGALLEGADALKVISGRGCDSPWPDVCPEQHAIELSDWCSPCTARKALAALEECVKEADAS